MTNASGGPYWLRLRATADGAYEVTADESCTRYTVDHFEEDTEGRSNEPIRVLRIDLPGYGEPPKLIYSPGRGAFAKKAAKKAAKGAAWSAFIALEIFIARENARKGYIRGLQVTTRQLPGSPQSSAQSALKKGALGAAASAGYSVLRRNSSVHYTEVLRIMKQPVEGYYMSDSDRPVVRGPVRRGDLTTYWMTFGE